jgi:hypothetical protein
MTQPTDGFGPDHSRAAGEEAGIPAPQAHPAEGVGLSDPPAAEGTPSGGSPLRRRGLVAGGLAAALVLGLGGAYAVQQLSGTGPRPAEVMPGDTYGYVQVDIDPAAGQKLAAVRFLSTVPEIKALADGDARKKLWDLAVAEADNECISGFDYDKDIAPWLGDRVGFGMRPGGTATEPNVVAALQVTDLAKATGTLNRLTDCGDSMDVRSKDDYVLLTPKGQGDSALSAIGQGTLAQKATFQEDLAALGQQGIASTWWDLGTAAKEVGNVASGMMLGMKGAAPADVEGRVVATLRFDPGYAEVAGLARGLTGAQTLEPVDGDSRELANLPDDTMAALHLSGGEQLIDQIWPELQKQFNGVGSSSGFDDPLGMLEDQLGLTFPDDLKALVGSSFTVSLPDQDLGADMPAVGAKVVTSNAQRAQEVVETLEDAAGASGILTKKIDGGRLLVATTPDYATTLEAGGNLGDSEAFKAAIDDPANVDYALYADLDRFEKLYLGELDGDGRAVLEAIRSLGFASTVTASGEATFNLRVVAN